MRVREPLPIVSCAGAVVQLEVLQNALHDVLSSLRVGLIGVWTAASENDGPPPQRARSRCPSDVVILRVRVGPAHTQSLAPAATLSKGPLVVGVTVSAPRPTASEMR